MKVIALTLLLVASGFAAKINQGPVCPIDDPLDRPGGPLNVTLDPLAKIDEGGFRGAIQVLGLSSFQYVFTMDISTLTIHFEITLGATDLQTFFVGSGYVDARPFTQDCVPSGNFTGGGPVKVAASNVKIVASATLFVNLITNKISCRQLTVDEISFDSLAVDLSEHFIIGGSPVDWAAWTTNFPSCFAAQYTPNQAEIVDKIRLAANNVLVMYTLEEFLELLQPDSCDPRTY